MRVITKQILKNLVHSYLKRELSTRSLRIDFQSCVFSNYEYVRSAQNT